MNPINIAGFAGANLAINARLLNEAVGVHVIDAEPGRGDLRPLHAPLTVATVPTGTPQKAIYRMGRDTPNDAQYWLSWSTIVNAIRGFDENDTTERTYFTGSGTPKWTDNVMGLSGGPPYPQATRELAMPAPIVALIATETSPGIGDDGTVFYVHTFVNDLGWESAPSPVSIGLTCKPGAIVDLTGLPAAPAGNYGINRRRIYRTSVGSTGVSVFLFLREETIGTTSTTDDARALGDELATGGWDVPPADAYGLIGLWNGMASMLSGKAVWFTEPYTPYATPSRYKFPVQNKPVAQAKWEQNLLVLTTGAPVILQGQDPNSMSETPSRLGFACMSARSVVEFKHGVVWASNEGLAYTGSDSLLTEGVLTQRQWKLLKPETMIAGRYGRLYVCSYDDGTGSRKGFMFDPLSPAQGIWFLSTGFDACWYDELSDQLYVLEGGNVRKFDGGDTLLTAKYTSKKFHQTSKRNFAWCKVVADAYPVTAKVYADGVLRHQRTVPSEDAFTLPDGFIAEDWQGEVQSSVGSVQAMRLAVDERDFKGL